MELDLGDVALHHLAGVFIDHLVERTRLGRRKRIEERVCCRICRAVSTNRRFGNGAARAVTVDAVGHRACVGRVHLRRDGIGAVRREVLLRAIARAALVGDIGAHVVGRLARQARDVHGEGVVAGVAARHLRASARGEILSGAVLHAVAADGAVAARCPAATQGGVDGVDDVGGCRRGDGYLRVEALHVAVVVGLGVALHVGSHIIQGVRAEACHGVVETASPLADPGEHACHDSRRAGGAPAEAVVVDGTGVARATADVHRCRVDVRQGDLV